MYQKLAHVGKLKQSELRICPNRVQVGHKGFSILWDQEEGTLSKASSPLRVLIFLKNKTKQKSQSWLRDQAQSIKQQFIFYELRIRPSLIS